MQRCKVMALVNSSGDYLLFDKTYETKNGFLSCLVVEAMEAKISHTHEETDQAMPNEQPEDNYMSPARAKKNTSHEATMRPVKPTANFLTDHYMCPGEIKERTMAKKRLKYNEITPTPTRKDSRTGHTTIKHDKGLKRRKSKNAVYAYTFFIHCYTAAICHCLCKTEEIPFCFFAINYVSHVNN